MKRIFALALCALAVFALAGCSGDNGAAGRTLFVAENFVVKCDELFRERAVVRLAIELEVFRRIVASLVFVDDKNREVGAELSGERVGRSKSANRVDEEFFHRAFGFFGKRVPSVFVGVVRVGQAERFDDVLEEIGPERAKPLLTFGEKDAAEPTRFRFVVDVAERPLDLRLRVVPERYRRRGEVGVFEVEREKDDVNIVARPVRNNFLRSVANRGGEGGELGVHRGTFREKRKRTKKQNRLMKKEA